MLLALSSAGLVAAAAAAEPVPAEQYHFTVQQKMDVTGHDIVHVGAEYCPPNAPKGGPVCNVDALKMRCLYMPGCVGFNTDGWLKNSTANPVSGQPCDFYTKVPGRPSAFHFLKIDHWDAENEDLRNLGTHDLPTLQKACAAEPQCAAYNSNGWLKKSVQFSAADSDDLYVKTGGVAPSGPPLPVPPPPPPPWKCTSSTDTDYQCHPKSCDLVHRVGITSPEACCALCTNNPLCFATSWHSREQVPHYTCILKGKGAIPQHSPNTTSCSCSGAHPPLPPSAVPPPPPPPPGPWAPRIWPLPRHFTNGSTTLLVVKPRPGASLFTLAGAAKCDTLTAAFARYLPLTLPHPVEPSTESSLLATGAYGGSVSNVVVTVEDVSEAHPQLTTNESYTLSVSASGVVALVAPSVWGALRGLETFSQMVIFDFDTQVHTLPLAPWAINDAPRFPHRGLMIDTSRHFETVNTIKRMITSLSFAKLNVLHWHMSDDQSFPFESQTHPKLWQAAYSSQERYSQLDIHGVVEFARLRGVRVMVEFDVSTPRCLVTAE